MSASGNPSYANDSGATRGVPVVSAPGPLAEEPANTPHPADVAHIARLQETPSSTGWSPTAWRRARNGGGE